MQQPSLGFDLWHEDGLVFETEPALFVDLNASPIIFTVRGISYFRPRFKHVGISIADLHSRAQFEAAEQRWMEVEWVLLRERIDTRANARTASADDQVLQAILNRDVEEVERLVSRLEHRKRAGLKLV